MRSEVHLGMYEVGYALQVSLISTEDNGVLLINAEPKQRWIVLDFISRRELVVSVAINCANTCKVANVVGNLL